MKAIKTKRKPRKNERVICGEIYWSTVKAAEFLGVNRFTLLGWVRGETIRHTRIGTYAMFKKEWLEEYIQKKTQGGE